MKNCSPSIKIAVDWTVDLMKGLINSDNYALADNGFVPADMLIESVSVLRSRKKDINIFAEKLEARLVRKVNATNRINRISNRILFKLNQPMRDLQKNTSKGVELSWVVHDTLKELGLPVRLSYLIKIGSTVSDNHFIGKSGWWHHKDVTYNSMQKTKSQVR